MKSTDFNGLIVADEQRQLALKGLCTIARKEDGAHVFVLLKEGSDRHRVADAAGEGAMLIREGAGLEEIAASVIGKFGSHSPEVWRYAKSKVLSKSKLWEVHLAKSPKTNSDVFLAQLTESFAKDEELRAEFVNGAVAAKAVMHDALPRIRDVGGKDDIPFVASDLSAGLSLGELARRFAKGGPWPTPETSVWIASEIVSALETAHTAGIVHGAVSPETVWLCASGRVQLLHLGVAGFLGMLERSMGASLGMSAANPYIAPEQVKQTGADQRTDIFSVGIILHELLTRHTVFLRPNAGETKNAIVAAPIPRPNAGCSDAIADVTMSCLERNPAFRPKSAQDLRAELSTALSVTNDPPREELATLVKSAFT